LVSAALVLLGTAGLLYASVIWTLHDVRFDDATTAVGSFVYDDIADTYSASDIQVQDAGFMPAYRYLPGVETHPLPSHSHQEIIVVIEATIEVSMDGKTDTVEAGSGIFYEANKPHNLRDVGTKPCRYYVAELRGRTGRFHAP
jgi:mannose-6-phosphate isomerase-like protein (cupin superfamily)